MTTASRIAVLFAGAALLAGPVADAQPPKLPRPGADGPPPLEPTGFKLVEKIETKENTILAMDVAAEMSR